MRFACALGFAVVALAAIDPDLPSPAPIVRAAFPPGAQRGTAAEVELSGQNLHDARSIVFAGRGVRAEILSALGSRLRVRITIDATAEVGRRDYRLTTARGVYVGVFDIGALPEITEIENNDDPRKAQPVTLPLLVNGNIGSEDWDHFRFHAAAGQTMIFDVSATRHGSRLDADVALLDANGRELAWVDDTTIFGDPHLEFTFDKAGDYIVRVGSLNGGGNYRLSAGGFPYPRRTLPAGLRAGTTTELTFTGTLLDMVDEIWIGDRTAKGRILSRSAGELRAAFHLPATATPGPSRVHLISKGLEVALPTEIRISSLPEVTISTPPRTIETALPVTGSAVLNGVLAQPKESHYFRLEARAGETFVFRAESMKLGYHLDPTLTVFDVAGRKLAFADDPGIDDRADEYQLDTDLSFRAETAGSYLVAIRDGMYRGGDQLLYRLSIERQPPTFILEVRESLKSFYQGQQDTLQVRVRRRSGWDAPVEVWAEGLPTHASIDRQTAAPKDSIVKDTCGVERAIDGTIVLLPVRIGKAPPGVYDLKVKARGVFNGRAVEQEAIVRYNHASAGYLYGPMQVERAQLTIAPPPSVLLTGPDTAPAGGTVKLAIRRFGTAKGKPVVLRVKGSASSVSASADAKEITLPVTAAAGERLVVEAISDGGSEILGESAPILIEASK